MAERLPSLELVAGVAGAERERMLRHADAIDAKAGIVLGFAGALVAITAGSFDWWRVPGMVFAALAVLDCLRAFLPDRYPVLELRALRDQYLRSELVFTRLELLDTEIFMAEAQSALIKANARRLRRAVTLVFAAAVTLIAGTMIAELRG